VAEVLSQELSQNGAKRERQSSGVKR